MKYMYSGSILANLKKKTCNEKTALILKKKQDLLWIVLIVEESLQNVHNLQLSLNSVSLNLCERNIWYRTQIVF